MALVSTLILWTASVLQGGTAVSPAQGVDAIAQAPASDLALAFTQIPVHKRTPLRGILRKRFCMVPESEDSTSEMGHALAVLASNSPFTLPASGLSAVSCDRGRSPSLPSRSAILRC